MEIPSIPPSVVAQPASEGPLGSQTLGEQDFLLMLITQLTNQDPLNPMEGSEFAAQLAQFTSVEQLLSLNETLAGQGEIFNMLAETMGESLVAQGQMLGLLSDSLNRSAATSLIGASVDVPGNAVHWDGVTPAPLVVELDAPAATLTITILDENGEALQTFTIEGAEAGRQEVLQTEYETAVDFSLFSNDAGHSDDQQQAEGAGAPISGVTPTDGEGDVRDEQPTRRPLPAGALHEWVG